MIAPIRPSVRQRSHDWTIWPCLYRTSEQCFYTMGHNCLQSPPKESIHLRQSQVLKDQGKYRKSRGCITPQMKLVQSGPSLILIFQEMQPFLWISKWGLAQFGPTQWLVWRTLNFSSGRPSVLSTRLDKSVYFLLGETVLYTRESGVGTLHRQLLCRLDKSQKASKIIPVYGMSIGSVQHP